MPNDGHRGATMASTIAPERANPEETMETTRRTEDRKTRHAKRLARRSIGAAGTPTNVGKALERARSTVSHEGTDREHPALRDAFAVLLRLDAYPEVSGRAFAEAVSEAVELSEIVHADDETLIARGLWLLDGEDPAQGRENTAARLGLGYWDACEATGQLHVELAQIGRECELRGIDLLKLQRERTAAA